MEEESELFPPELNFANIVIVGGLPFVEEKKRSTFLKYLEGVSKRKIDPNSATFQPTEDKKQMILFVVQESEEEAKQLAISLDVTYKNYKFTATRLSDFFEVEGVPDTYTEPEVPPFQEKKDLYSWMLDKQARSQYLLYRTSSVKCQFFDPLRGVETIFEEIGESRPMWSPNGTFLASHHAQGVLVRGGPHLDSLIHVPHPNVQFFVFGYLEAHMLTYSYTNFLNGIRVGRPRVWRIDPLESFEVPLDIDMKAHPLHWSSDENWFAYHDIDTLRLMQLPSMEQHQIIVPNLQPTMCWSPNKPFLAIWAIGKQETIEKKKQQGKNTGKEQIDVEDEEEKEYTTIYHSPSQLRILNVKKLQFEAVKTAFDAVEVYFSWSLNSEFLIAICSNQVRKTKVGCTLELFRVSEKDIPVDTLVIKEDIINFRWEPINCHFALLQGESRRPTPVIYSTKKSGKIEMLCKLESRPCNNLFWAPSGDYLVIAQLSGSGNFWGTGIGQSGMAGLGTIEIYSAQLKRRIASFIHPLASSIMWDPTGRYLAVAVEGSKDTAGFSVYNARGDIVYESGLLPGLARFMWRPNAPLVLSKEEQVKIEKDLNVYSERFEKEDEAFQQSAEESRLEELDQKRFSFIEWRKTSKNQTEEERSSLFKLSHQNRSLKGSHEIVWVTTDEEVLVEIGREETLENLDGTVITSLPSPAPSPFQTTSIQQVQSSSQSTSIQQIQQEEVSIQPQQPVNKVTKGKFTIDLEGVKPKTNKQSIFGEAVPVNTGQEGGSVDVKGLSKESDNRGWF